MFFPSIDDVDAELLQHVPHRVHVLRHAVLDQQLAARDDRQADVRADLDVIAVDVEVAAVQRLDAADVQRVRGDPFDLRAHLVQKVTEVLHVRLGRGVVDERLALGEHGRHDGVLGRGHRGLVEEHLLPLERARFHPVLVRGDLDLRAEGFQRQEVRVDAAPADGIAARLGHRDAAAARQQRTGQQDRGADLLRQLDVGETADLALGLDADHVRFQTLDARAEPLHDLQHHPNVLDVRQVAEHDRLIRQADTPPGSAAPRSCSRRDGSSPRACGHLRQ